MSTQRFKLLIAYRGTQYFGWKSINDEGSLPTVQGVLRTVIRTLVGHPVILVGSSRTDSGVHAKGQVAHFDTTCVEIPENGLMRAINHRLPSDIVVLSVERVEPTFHAILNTASKRYQYVIWQSERQPVFGSGLVWFRDRKHNIELMCEAAKHLEGTHDFTSFCKAGHGRLTAVRTVHSCTVAAHGPRIVIGVEGGGFLWNMVRIIAGTLSEVGMGRFTPDDVKRILEAQDRTVGGTTAPPDGLYLQWIKFKKQSSQMTNAQVEDESDADLE